MSLFGLGSFRFDLRLSLAPAIVLLILAGAASAQTKPGTASPGDPFEVHGLLYSGSAPAGYPLGDGWAQGTSFLGVLDANGNPATDSSGAPFRASLQVDENWGNAGHGDDLTVFASGNKNEDLIGAGDSPWTWDIGGGGPQKNDITNAYFHTRTDPVTGDRWVFVAAETRSINGDSHVDFEFNQAGIAKVGITGGELIGLGPDGGRTVDDFMISIDFEQGGETPVANVRFWNGVLWETVSVPGAAFSATNSVDIPHGAGGTWKHFTDDGAEIDVLTRLQLVEGAANLTALGIDVNPCSTDATFIVKSRSSSSWTSDLKDFAQVHFPMEPMPDVTFEGPSHACAGDTIEVSAKDLTGLHDIDFLWAIEGCGSIISDPNADTITIQVDPVCNCEIGLEVTTTGGECRHVTVAKMTVTVSDDVVPVLNDNPADFTIECDSVSRAPALAATDNCSEPVVQLDETEEPGVCVGDSTITRAWTATDECDNVSSHTQVITVEDTTAPSLAGVPSDVAVQCDSFPEPAEVTATDNCSDVVVQFNENTEPGRCVGDATITRTWTATDNCGNQSAQSRIITLLDDTAPVLSGVPTDATVECDALPAPAEVAATDNCSEAVVELSENTEPGRCVGESVVTRTWAATDECGNQSSQTQTITVVDTAAPVLVGVPADITVECDSIPAPPEVTATDNCSDPSVELIEQMEGGIGVGKAVITRTWTATDDCGNQTSQTQVIVVVDTTAPALVDAPADMTVECDSVPDPAMVTATDNCAVPPVEFTENVEPGPCNGQLTITRTWTATDDCGNQTSQSQVITVVDTTMPVLIAGPVDETVECDSVTLPAEVTATDNCSDASVDFSESAEPGVCLGESTITRTWTATDECGNQASYVQIIHVIDTTAPILSDDPVDVTAECDSVPTAQTLSAGDNCDTDVPVSPGEQTVPGDCAGDYALLRSWIAADECGNESGVDQTVTVQDTTPPALTLSPTGTQFICDGEPVSFTVATTDNCVTAELTSRDIVAITADSLNHVTVTPLAEGVARITVDGPAMVMGSFAATDGCGNVSEAFQFSVFARIGREACSQGFWKNHYDLWGPTGFSPDDLFLAAFEITDLSSTEIPANFDVNVTLRTTARNTSGELGQMLVHGTGALLNAAHPDVEFPATVADVRTVMQAAFAGIITFDEARAQFGVWNIVERECGCPAE